MRKSLTEIASILDEDIKKSNKKKDNTFKKSLSHNPFNPVDMGNPDNAPYYESKYMQLGDGSFAPYPKIELMRESPRSKEGDYLTNDSFYRYVHARNGMDKELERVIRSVVEDIDLKKSVPIGTVHRHKDGKQYKKVSSGKWLPMSKEDDTLPHQEIESHAAEVGGRRQRVEDALERHKESKKPKKKQRVDDKSKKE